MPTWGRNPGGPVRPPVERAMGRIPVAGSLLGVAPSPWIDQARAADRCEDLLQDTLGAVRPGLVWQRGVECEGARLPAPEDGPGGAGVHWYVSRSRDILTIVSVARRACLLGAVEADWRRRGFTITAVSADLELPGLCAITRDGYRLALGFGELGNACVAVVSPGVARSPWPRHPPAAPGGTECAPLPQVRCPFWTAFE